MALYTMNYDSIVAVDGVGPAEPREPGDGILDVLGGNVFEWKIRKRLPIAGHYLDRHMPGICVY
jgi:hypothetical protein